MNKIDNDIRARALRRVLEGICDILEGVIADIISELGPEGSITLERLLDTIINAFDTDKYVKKAFWHPRR